MIRKKYIFLTLCIVILSVVYAARKPILRQGGTQTGKEHNDIIEENTKDADQEEIENEENKVKTGCWMMINSNEYFETMDKLDAQYESIRRSYQDTADKENFDTRMLNAILTNRGVASRNLNAAKHTPTTIPSGLNLGAQIMFRMRTSILFFHRLKLRNNTQFRINFLHHDLMNMALVARLSLHDLHFQGSYERALSDRDPSILFYAPTFGSVGFLLKNVTYKVEGRYRLLQDRLTIDMISSEIKIGDIVMAFNDDAVIEDPDLRLDQENIVEFADKIKKDLDKWLKDYFNDYLMYFSFNGGPIKEFQKYVKVKEVTLNNFADNFIRKLNGKMRTVNATAVKIPSFTIYAINSMAIKLHSGVIKGLNTMYRRSIATGKQEKDVRKVDAVVAFSKLKVIYKYEIALSNEVPLLTGMLYLTSDELTAHMSVMLANNSDTFDLSFQVLDQTKPESLIVQGSASTLIANFKHILEHHIIALMSNALFLNIKALGTLNKCEPELNVPKHDDSDDYVPEDIVLIQDAADKNSFEQLKQQDLKKVKTLEIKSSAGFQEAFDTNHGTSSLAERGVAETLYNKGFKEWKQQDLSKVLNLEKNQRVVFQEAYNKQSK